MVDHINIGELKIYYHTKVYCGWQNKGPSKCSCPNPENLRICYIICQGGIKIAHRMKSPNQLTLT